MASSFGQHSHMQVGSFLVHYSRLTSRLPKALGALGDIGLYPEVITCWDGDTISDIECFNHFEKSAWLKRINLIKPLLLRNAGVDVESDANASRPWKSATEAIANSPTWLLPRPLRTGEISVILKHYYALSRIAQGTLTYGLIAEDDILTKKDSHENFDVSMQEFYDCNGDYLDLAGGCGLAVGDVKASIARIYPPATRTNACYVVSRELARRLVNNFFPFVHPIDWHLMYLLNDLNIGKCFWATREVFIHGSESGAYISWREADV